MNDIRVSFAFLTPRSLECCFGRSPSLTDGGSSQRDVDDVSDNIPCRVVHVRLLDFEGGSARVLRVSLWRDAVMGELYDALRRDEVRKNANFVCFELAKGTPRHGTSLAISRVLKRDDWIPTVVFAQHVWQGPDPAFVKQQKWVAVNVLACGADGEIFLAHIPFVVPLAPEELSRTALLASVAQVLCLSSECEEQLRSCVVLACRFDGQRITLEEPLLGNFVGEQVAIMYNSFDIGDVVVVAAQWYRGTKRSQTPIVQGVVTRRFVQDGVLFFDVKEVDTSVVIEKLSCVQLVPL